MRTKPILQPPANLPKGSKVLDDTDPRGQDVIALIHMINEKLDTYVDHHDDPGIAMQNIAVATMAVAGEKYGILRGLGLLNMSIDDIMVGVRHNFETSYLYGIERIKDCVADYVKRYSR